MTAIPGLSLAGRTDPADEHYVRTAPLLTAFQRLIDLLAEPKDMFVINP
ncbi:MAG: hypothetical protein HY881_19310 [Deltaproteobacteria bacterium]|nr:hypothetical protein [Deltaproteobacteria bacterium]